MQSVVPAQNLSVELLGDDGADRDERGRFTAAYDEHRFRIVHDRAHVFEVKMGGKYAVDGHRVVEDAMDADRVDDDLGDEQVGSWVPLPEKIANDLRLHLEAESDGSG